MWRDSTEARDTDEDELDREIDAQAERATTALRRPNARARELLRDMLSLAERARHEPDAKARALLHWIRENQCPGVGFGQSKLPNGAGPWQGQRLIVFTEYADTKRYLTQLLQGAIDGTRDAEHRIVGFHGAMSDDQRERVQQAFNGDLEKYPARILIATDAAREGLNLQNHKLLRDAVNVGLELATESGRPLQPLDASELAQQGLDTHAEVYALPDLPPSWERTLDSLRAPKQGNEPDWEWRQRPLQPVVFKPLARIGEDRVHLHLEHPLVQRILSRFLSQGFSSHDLSRVTIIPNDRDGLVRVIAFGRISLFGPGATRLHDQVLSVAAQWLESRAEGHLRPFADQADRRAITTLEDLLADPARLEPIPAHIQKRVLESAATDFAALWAQGLRARTEPRGGCARELRASSSPPTPNTAGNAGQRRTTAASRRGHAPCRALPSHGQTWRAPRFT